MEHYVKARKQTSWNVLIESQTQSSCPTKPPTDVTIIDGAVLVNILKPIGCKTFGEYASNIFVPKVARDQQYAHRVDIVWDQYYKNSLKIPYETKASMWDQSKEKGQMLNSFAQTLATIS